MTVLLSSCSPWNNYNNAIFENTIFSHNCLCTRDNSPPSYANDNHNQWLTKQERTKRSCHVVSFQVHTSYLLPVTLTFPKLWLTRSSKVITKGYCLFFCGVTVAPRGARRRLTPSCMLPILYTVTVSNWTNSLALHSGKGALREMQWACVWRYVSIPVLVIMFGNLTTDGQNWLVYEQNSYWVVVMFGDENLIIIVQVIVNWWPTSQKVYVCCNQSNCGKKSGGEWPHVQHLLVAEVWHGGLRPDGHSEVCCLLPIQGEASFCV